MFKHATVFSLRVKGWIRLRAMLRAMLRVMLRVMLRANAGVKNRGEKNDYLKFGCQQ